MIAIKLIKSNESMMSTFSFSFGAKYIEKFLTFKTDICEKIKCCIKISAVLLGLLLPQTYRISLDGLSIFVKRDKLFLIFIKYNNKNICFKPSQNKFQSVRLFVEKTHTIAKFCMSEGGAHLLFQYLFSNGSDLTKKLLHRVGHLHRYYYPVETGPNYF
ncbi:hypothetical protein BpHYR1_043879 [Brachionus plicatilis]|uniref:Uncharacterized protein n=1 Tax=Brachionus plicatilis TaxID=10195 RepID=A0A3M7T7M5_BRAPC|nr:hypothetical protein BpHYR1_043879 [Brachionus plicatilis]